MHVIVASVSSHLVVRTWCFWKIIEKKIEKKINIDLALIASQTSERWFMTLPSSFLQYLLLSTMAGQVAEPSTLATPVVASSPLHHLNVCLGTGCGSSCIFHDKKFGRDDRRCDCAKCYDY